MKLLADKDPKVQAIAAREILDRAHGKPMSPQEITGKDGEPLHPAPDMSNTEIARRLIFSAALDLRKQGYSLGKDGTITPSGKSASPQPATDRRAEIEAAQAAMAKQAAAEPGPIAEEEEAARQAREAERYYATRHEEQGLTDNSTFNVIRMRPKHA